METVTSLADFCDKYAGGAVALGTFDGVHVGHQEIIGRAVELANQGNGISLVFTFQNHPLSIIAPQRCPARILLPKDKAAKIEKLGVKVLLSITITPEFLLLSPNEFIDLLITRLRPRHIVVGPNYTFGYRGAGTPDMLREAGKRYNFDVHIHTGVYTGDALVSSTSIRKLITVGDVGKAAKLLGAPFAISGIVTSGDKRGRSLGYPTANINIPNDLVTPANGVYAVAVNTSAHSFYGVANIGNNPTFGGNDRRLETFILDFAGNLYGEEVVIHFLDRLRDEQRFTDAEALKEQIALDIQQAKSYLEALMQ